MDDFKNFFKPSKQKSYEIEEVINKVYKMIGYIYKIQKINIKLSLEKSLRTEGYSNELSQVIINVLNNARDAIKENSCDIRDIDIATFSTDDKAFITITDYAGGVKEDIIDKIFDPYFTTKSDDKGTGIGLDMTKTILEKVNGSITVKNIEKSIKGKNYKGARFQIELPLSK